MTAMSQGLVTTNVNVENAVRVYKRMRAASETRRTVMLEVAADLRKAAAEVRQGDGYNDTGWVSFLTKLAKKLESN